MSQCFCLRDRPDLPFRAIQRTLKGQALCVRSGCKRITIEEGKCGGRPYIRGQRIRVTDVLELLGAGASFEEILKDYAFLKREDILAAIECAAHQTDTQALQSAC